MNYFGTLLNFEDISCKAVRTATLSFTSGTSKFINWTAENYDTHDMHDPVTNNTRITIPKDGKYLIVLNARFVTNSTGDRWCGIYINGSAKELNVQSASNNTSCDLAMSALRTLNKDDYIEGKAFQDSGGNLNLDFFGSNLSVQMQRLT